jgi:UDP-N-acetylglucosamine 2-epimerase (non-hydrolysing)
LVLGDTTTAFVAGLAAHYAGIPVGHVEAGLRTYDWHNPFPEESNRQMLSRISTWCFAPTTQSQTHLRNEQIPVSRIHVTGNTGIDALVQVLGESVPETAIPPYLLVTLHRRESFGEPLLEVLGAVKEFLRVEPEVTVIWPVHPNPTVRAMADRVFGNHPRVQLIAPQTYSAFAKWMRGAKLILTDSGGVQEEAPSLGKRVLVARDTTERPEAVDSGHNRLVGRKHDTVLHELQRAWHEPAYTGPIPAGNPFGDGRASERIVNILEQTLE